jgi:hypothetical protein
VHTLGLVLWFSALPKIPLADMTAIGFTGPIFIMIGAWLFLGEPMRWERWVATAVGFVGMLVVLGPKFSGQRRLVAPGDAGLGAGVRGLVPADQGADAHRDHRGHRVLAGADGHAVQPAAGAAGVAVAHGLQWAGFAVCGLLGTRGHYCLTRSYRHADISATQSVKFLDLVWASTLGLIVFADVPHRQHAARRRLISAATLWLARRESRALAHGSPNPDPLMPDPHADSRYAWTRLMVTLADDDHRLGRHVRHPGGAAGGAGRIRRGAGRCLAALHGHDDRLRLGGIWMGRLADRHGVMWPRWSARPAWPGLRRRRGCRAASPASAWRTGCCWASSARRPPLRRWWPTPRCGSSRRGIAVAICASGNYLAGAIWPPIVQHFVAGPGLAPDLHRLGVLCALTLPLLALRCARGRRRRPATAATLRGAQPSDRPFGLSLNQAQVLLCIAGTACCVAMAMPQVHIVAYCGDLGYGAARGAEMLSLMLACGIVSRLVSGAICDRIGGLRTLLLGSVLQGVALLLFLPFDGLVSLYVISALFGLFQGGIVPSYAIIVREHFPPAEAGARVGTVIMFTLFGMALGGWMSGKVFDLTGSYHAAFVNGIVWNLINLSWPCSCCGALKPRASRLAVPA